MKKIKKVKKNKIYSFSASTATSSASSKSFSASSKALRRLSRSSILASVALVNSLNLYSKASMLSQAVVYLSSKEDKSSVVTKDQLSINSSLLSSKKESNLFENASVVLA